MNRIKNKKFNRLVLFSFILLAATATTTPVKAQTFAEWFQQDATQKKYLLAQIAALQFYEGAIQSGYQIVSGGLQTVHGFTSSEFTLHHDYFASLGQINPEVSANPQVKEIIAAGTLIGGNLQAMRAAPLSPEEKAVVAHVADHLQQALQTEAGELQDLLTPGKYQFKDAQRLNRLQQLHDQVLDQQQFSSTWLSQVRLYAVQKQQELRDNQNLQRNYEQN